MSVRRGLLTFGAAVAAWLASAATPVSAAGIVCWDEADGRRACGDRVPPEYVKQERQVYDSKGRLLRTLPRQRTPEEVAADAKLAAEQVARRKKLEEAAAYDRFLQSTFGSAEDLERTRDDRLATLDGRLSLAEKSLTGNQKGIAQLEEQIAEFQGKNPDKKVPVRLSKQLAEFTASLESNTRVVDELRGERKAIVDKFDYDIRRFRELTGDGAEPDGGDETTPDVVPASQ